MFGPHLMLDCYECDKEKLGNEKFILNFLNELPELLSMHIIHEPFIIPYEENSETWDKGGISAVVIIAESHISIHTFPENDSYATIDLFSCKDFDIESAINFVMEKLNPKKIERNLIFRGKHFPKDKYATSKIIREQRKNIKDSN
ncbi:MAG: adenosylmethionine decarboxylase [Nanoarchaeota archaeon]